MSLLLKYWFNIDNIYQTIQPICRCMKWIGFMPFTVVHSRAAEVGDAASLQMKPTDALLLVCWQLYILQLFITDWFSVILDIPMSKIMIYFSIFLYYIQAFMLCAVQLLVAFSRAKIEEVLRLVKFTDDLLDKFAIGVNHRQHHMNLVLLMFGSVCGTLLAFAVELQLTWRIQDHADDCWREYYIPTLIIFTYVCKFVQICPLVVFIGGLLAFRSRFSKLNELFRLYFENQEENLLDEDVQKHLKLLAICHDSLSDAVSVFNDIFGIQVVFACVPFIVFSIFSMYSFGAMLSRGSPDVVFLTMFYNTANLVYAFYIIPIAKLGSDVASEGKKMAVLVHKAINQSPLSASSINRLRLFSQQLQQQTPIVSCGMFSFDWTLCFSILSVTATYTMIMIQFELEVPKFFIGAILKSQHSDNATLLELETQR